EKRVGGAETEIAEGTESRLIVEVAAADGFLEIKRNGVGGAGVGHRDSNASGKNAVEATMAVGVGFGIKIVAKVRDETAEGIVAGVSVVEIAVAEAVVELDVILRDGEMRTEHAFDVNKGGLGGNAGSGGFVKDLPD